MYRPDLIVSGGQTGADQAALRAAKALGIPTGGWVPKGCRTEEGDSPWLVTEYNCTEHSSLYDYEPRTRLNVQLGHATVIFGRRSPGSNLTERLCQYDKKPYLWLWYGGAKEQGKLWELTPTQRQKFQLWLVRHAPSCLNVAGNRESTNPGIGAAVEAFLLATIPRE